MFPLWNEQYISCASYNIESYLIEASLVFIFLQFDTSIRHTIITIHSNEESTTFNIGIPVGIFPYTNADIELYQLIEVFNKDSTTAFGIRSINMHNNGSIDLFKSQQLLVYYISF